MKEREEVHSYVSFITIWNWGHTASDNTNGERQLKASFVLTKSRPDEESILCSNSGEEKPFFLNDRKLGWNGRLGFIYSNQSRANCEVRSNCSGFVMLSFENFQSWWFKSEFCQYIYCLPHLLTTFLSFGHHDAGRTRNY